LRTSLQGCLEALCLTLSLFGEAREDLGPSGFWIEAGNLCKARVDVGTCHIKGNRLIYKGALALCDGNLTPGKEALALAEGDFAKAKAFSLGCRRLAVGLLGEFGLGTKAGDLALCADDQGALLLARLFEDGGSFSVCSTDGGGGDHAS
jgi:hypothetical protein